MPGKIKIAIVDDQEIVRSGVISLLAPYKDIEIVFQAINGQFMLDLLPKNPVDVILLDIEMPVLDGLDALKMIRKNDSITRVIFLSIHNEFSFVQTAMNFKANGYLLKTANGLELYTAIKESYEKGVYLSGFASELLLNNIIHKNHLNPLDSSPYFEFNERETAVLDLVCQGKTSRQIAKILLLSKRCVDMCRSDLLKMTNTQNVVEFITYCIENKLYTKKKSG